MRQERNTMGPGRTDIARIFSNSLFYLVLPSEHGRGADLKGCSLFKQELRYRGTANLGSTLDGGFMIFLAPSVRCIEQLRPFLQHFSYFVEISVSRDYELSDKFC